MQDLIDQGLAHHRAGRLAEADPFYREVLRRQPGHPVALHLLGVMALQTGRPDQAVDWINRALVAKPDFPEAHTNLGNALKTMGRVAEAIAAFRRAIAIRPEMAEAHNNLGLCLLAANDAAQALAAYDRALALNPAYFEARIGRAQALEALRRHDEAAQAYGDAVALRPDSADLRNAHGNALRLSGRFAEAAAAYGEAVRLRPDFVEFHVNQGVALTDARRLAEAQACLRAALALDRGHLRATIALGVVLGIDDKGDEAVAILRRAVELAPDNPIAHANLGMALLRTGHPAEAIDCQRAALRLKPDHVAAHVNLAIILLESGRPDDALAAVDAALGRHPDHPDALLTRARILKAAGCAEEALELAERVASLRPSADALMLQATILQSLWRHEDAIAANRAALALWPDSIPAAVNLGNSLDSLGQHRAAAETYQGILARHPRHALVFGNLLNNAMYRDDLDAGALATLHRRYGEAMRQEPLAEPPLPPARPDQGGRRLRIGYLSSDLRNHPVAFNLLPLIRAHDRVAFEVHFYAHVIRTDACTERLRGLADGWHDITRLSDAEAARLIRADGIDILVSLAGRFDQNRPQICAWRPAPIQISMHDVATSGLDAMDYIVGDGRLLARPSPEYFSERRLRLPSFYIADPLPSLPPRPAVLRSGPPVFASFSNPIKLSATTLGLWGRVLARLPEASLTLKFHEAYRSDSLRQRVTGLTGAAGARPEQIRFLSDKDEDDGFFARYDEVDIALDTAPFTGSTTSFQALSLGVPLVTLAGDRMVGRWSTSMLRTLRLPELIAATPDEFVERAVAAGREVGEWRSRREEIRRRVAQSSLCDGDRWTRRLERLYRAVWRRYTGSE